jgi:hypothetical protein
VEWGTYQGLLGDVHHVEKARDWRDNVFSVLWTRLPLALVLSPRRSMDTNAFSSLTAVQLPSSSRLLASACCPDKDLLLLLTRLAGHDRMSLWKVSGVKTWEVDFGSKSEEVVGFDWSPDGMILLPRYASSSFSRLIRTEHCGSSQPPQYHNPFHSGWSRGA